jgi:hypothetical protein
MSIIYYSEHKINGKIYHITAREGPEGSIRIVLPFLEPRRETTVGSQRQTPGCFTPGKTRCPLYKMLGGSQGRSGRQGISSPHQDSIPETSSP